jgi:hypothetical protein
MFKGVAVTGKNAVHRDAIRCRSIFAARAAQQGRRTRSAILIGKFQPLCD